MVRAFRSASVVLAVVAGLGAGAATAQDKKMPVTMGILYVLADAGVFIAQDRGYFDEQGLDVKFQRFTSGADITALLATNQLDVGSGSASPGLYNSFRQGMDVQIVTTKAVVRAPQFGSGALFVRKDLWDEGRVKRPADLKGMKIGINSIASTSFTYTMRAIEPAGLGRNDVTFVEMPFTQYIPALERKAVDAVIAYAPLGDNLVHRVKLAVELPGSSARDTSDGDAANLKLYSPTFAKSDGATRFMIAHLKGLRDYHRAIAEDKGGRAEICDILNKHTSQVPPNCANITMSAVEPDGGINVASLERFQEEWIRWGLMRERADIRKHVNTSFVERALRELGPYK